MLQVIFIHTLVLAVDPAVPCKLALILQRGLGAPGEHRVRPKDESAFVEVQEPCSVLPAYCWRKKKKK